MPISELCCRWISRPLAVIAPTVDADVLAVLAGSTASLRSSLPDIKPRTAVASLDRGVSSGRPERFPIAAIAPLVGLSEAFIRRISGSSRELAVEDVLRLLDQDSFGETFVPRSQILNYLIARKSTFGEDNRPKVVPRPYALITGMYSAKVGAGERRWVAPSRSAGVTPIRSNTRRAASSSAAPGCC